MIDSGKLFNGWHLSCCRKPIKRAILSDFRIMSSDLAMGAARRPDDLAVRSLSVHL
jgi:hypothetical protein